MRVVCTYVYNISWGLNYFGNGQMLGWLMFNHHCAVLSSVRGTANGFLRSVILLKIVLTLGK